MADVTPGIASVSLTMFDPVSGPVPMCAGSKAASSPQQTTPPAAVTAQKKSSPPLMHASCDRVEVGTRAAPVPAGSAGFAAHSRLPFAASRQTVEGKFADP